MKKYFILIAMALIVLALAGCKKSEPYNATETTVSEGRHYLLYFLNDNEFSTAGYYTKTTDSAELVKELLGEMGLCDNEANDNEIRMVQSNVSNGTAYIYFNKAYETMANVYEVLFRASIVKTLSQLEDVDYVYFYIENMPLTYANGQIVGLMSEEDFIADSDSDLTKLAWDKLTLYFADAGGNGLVVNQVDVAYIKTVSKEELIVEQLVQGPEDESLLPTINPQVKVLGVTVKGDTCFVNLDASFIEQRPGIPFELALYSVVNSLCEIETVNRVQFQINGDSHVEVDGFSFEQYYTKNLDVMYKEVLQ